MDLSDIRFLNLPCGKGYQLPDMTGGVAILPVSGGADSAWLALLMHHLFPEIPWKMIFTDTGSLENPVEDIGVYETLDKLEAYLGKPIERLVPKDGLWEIIEKQGNFLPGPTSRYCTRMLKQVPFSAWLKQFDGQKKFLAVAIRADESDRLAFSLPDTETLMPFVDMGLKREDIFAGLAQTIGIPSLYRRRTRSGCAICPFMRRQELVSVYQERPIEFRKGERCEKVAGGDLTRWVDAMPLWKDSGISANWQWLPQPEDKEITGKRAKREADLFGARIYVGGEFFEDGGMFGSPFIWQQRVVSVAPTLHSIKQQLDDRYQHLLATAEVHDMTPDDVRRDVKFAIWVVELPSAVFDPEGPKLPGYTFQQGWSMRQLGHIVSWATRALNAESMRQQAVQKVRSELSVEAEWRDSAREGLEKTTEELGEIVASQWYQPQESREETEEEQLKHLVCPMCSL